MDQIAKGVESKANVLTVALVAFLSVISGLFLTSNPASALSNMVIQEVNINILEPDQDPAVPLTGANTTAATPTTSTDAAAAPLYIPVAAAAIVIISIILLLRKRKKTAAILALAACLAAPFLSVSTPTNAATQDPDIQLSSETLNYSLHAGETGFIDFSILATTSPNSVGYSLSNLSDNSSEDIILDITGGSYDDYAEIPTIETDDPLLLHMVNANAATGDTSNYTIAASVSDTIAPGSYTVMVVYFIDTDEGEFFRFTVDTRLTDTLDTDASHLGATNTTFAIPTSGYANQDESHNYSWLIDWGDDTEFEQVSGVSDDLSPGVPHTYDAPGMYQITIWPSSIASTGWLNAFGFYNTNAGANAQSNKNMFLSVDTSITNSMRTSGIPYRFAYMFFGAKNAIDIPPYLFDSISTDGAASTSNMFNSTFSGYAVNSTSAVIPGELFEYVDTSSTPDVSGMFTATFFNFASNSTVASIPNRLFSTIDTSSATDASNLFRDTFFGHATASTSATIPADLFSSIRLKDGVNASNMFGGTFYFYAGASTSGTIPDGLFATLDTQNAGNITGMFSGTFSGYARSSISGTIPANLFSTIDTSKQTDLAYLFNSAFSGYAYFSDTTIPANLFAAVDTSAARNLSSMFAGTFSSFANNSPSATIPSGLFDSINTANATNLASIFRDTFSNYAGISTVATIPTGLFDGVTTAKATNMPSMFSGTFYFFGHASPVVAIPANLFTGLDLSSADNVYEMFYRSFDSFGYVSTIPTDVNSIWGSANFAGRVTSDNASSFFNSTFSNVTKLTGSAQTFIDSKLGGIVPASQAHTFATTSVDDLATINENWRL